MEQYDSGIRTCWRISWEQVACCTNNNNSNRRKLFVAKKVRKPLLLWWIAGCLLVGSWVQFWKCHHARSKRERIYPLYLSSVESKKFECSVRDCWQLIITMIFGGVWIWRSCLQIIKDMFVLGEPQSQRWRWALSNWSLSYNNWVWKWKRCLQQQKK